MTTEQQIEANKANAQHSTGPRTPAGKRKSSQNAVKHGMRAQLTVLPGENWQQFQAIVAALVKQFKPANAIEWTLLRQLADAEWRMRRVPRFEAGLLFKELHDSREQYERRPEDLPEGSQEEENYLVGSMVRSDGRGADVLSKLSRYEARLSTRYFKALNHLQEAHDRRHPANPKAGKSAPANTTPKPRIQRIPRRSKGETTPKTKH